MSKHLWLGGCLPECVSGWVPEPDETEGVVTEAGGVVARLAGTYEPDRSVLLRKFLSSEAVIEEDGRRFINQIHRDDAAKAVFHLITIVPFPAGEIFNVCDSVTLTQKEVYQGLAGIFARDLPPSGVGAGVFFVFGCCAGVVSCCETQQLTACGETPQLQGSVPGP